MEIWMETYIQTYMETYVETCIETYIETYSRRSLVMRFIPATACAASHGCALSALIDLCAPPLLVVYSLFTPCLLVIYSLFTCHLLLVYLLFTPCLLVIYSLFTCRLLLVYLSFTPCLLAVYSNPVLVYSWFTCSIVYWFACCLLLVHSFTSCLLLVYLFIPCLRVYCHLVVLPDVLHIFTAHLARASHLMQHLSRRQHATSRHMYTTYSIHVHGTYSIQHTAYSIQHTGISGRQCMSQHTTKSDT